MKQAIQTKLLLLGVMMILFSLSTLGQLPILPEITISKSITIDFDIKIDNKVIHDSNYQLEIKNMTTGHVFNTNSLDKFTMQLEYNCTYSITLSRKNTNTKTIYIDTNAPMDNWYIVSGFDLTSNSTEHIYAGGIKYDKQLKTFKKYKL